MSKKIALPPTTEEAHNKLIYNSIIPKHIVRSNSFPFKTKPDKTNPYFGRIHKDLKESDNMQLSINEILGKVTEGYCIKVGAFQMQGYTPDEKSELREIYREDYNEYEIRAAAIEKKKQLELISTDLLVLDIDDRTGATDPKAVFEYSGALATYFSFSHGKTSVFHTKQNAYRLIYKLDNPITDENLLKHVQNALKTDLYDRFPQLLPVDGVKTGNNGIDTLGTGFFFGTDKKDYSINEQCKAIHVEPFAAEYAAEQELRKYTRAASTSTPLSTNDKEVLEMAEHLGDISGQLDFKEWTTVAIGLLNSAQAGVIEEETALEALSIIDGNAQNEAFYMKYKRPLGGNGSTATIGTFIKLATSSGFKRKFIDRYAAIESAEPEIPTDTIKQKEKHIPAKVIADVLNSSERKILLVSDTNSGKTYSTITACKTYLKDNPDAFVYYAAPTRALGGQVASKYDLGRSLQDDKQAHSFVNRAIYNGTRFIAGTFDKASKVLKSLPQAYKLVVVVDEAHKEVTDYNLRFKAIKNLFSIAESERVIKFLALTGTPQEIDLSNYDKRVIIERENKPDLASELLFIEYKKETLYTNAVTRIIAKEVNNGSKVLVFVNNKDEIETIRKALKKVNVKSVAVTADKRKSKTYSSLLTTEKIPEDIQVVLATNAIADGVNIENQKDYVCVIAPARNKAPFFNISLIKQASNRFRNTYKKLIIPIFIKQDLEEERLITRPNNLNGRYEWLLMDAKHTKNVIEERFRDRLDLYKPSVAEAIAGLFNTFMTKGFNFKAAYKEAEKQRLGIEYDVALVEQLKRIHKRLLTVDKRAKRYQASQDQETYYKNFPYAFKQAIMDITAIQQVNHVSMADYIKDEAEDDRTALLEELDRLEAQAALEAKEKREKVAEILTESLFDKLQMEYYSEGKINENTEFWEATKKALHKDHSSALKSIIGFLNYEQTIKELTRIQKRAQINELRNHLKYYADLKDFIKSEAAGKKNLTHTIIARLEQVFDSQTMTAGGRDELLAEVTAEFKGAKAKKTVADTFKYFFMQSDPKSKRINGNVVKVYKYELLSLKGMVSHHKFTESEIKEMYSKLHYNLKIKE
ncbi:hypothetical protein FM115_01520 [Marinilactibacillus psychrotolerans 42ea]|uniref:Helicase ATP-binding domain-containing protein n=1 Tax=Marinilactibacillus psychrotolerans 42ea TaxID=1255609 RepID=A0A1R4IL17_9LACT|nr:DEAD/DEAH box helicase family protein [Marinilactibacillus psychrotolerans]SJN20345.1 hypothetical protein FM115_01520 [Marinilactibacillus psychrotolerans 42ea]